MEEEQNKYHSPISRKYMLLIIILATVLLILILTFILVRNWNKTQLPNPANPTVTSVPNPSGSSQNQNISPSKNSLPKTITTPMPFTGAVDITISKEQQTTIDQERLLRRRSPIRTNTFLVSYNYGTDIFEVRYDTQRPDNRSIFEIWRKQNFPSILISRFIFTNE